MIRHKEPLVHPASLAEKVIIITLALVILVSTFFVVTRKTSYEVLYVTRVVDGDTFVALNKDGDKFRCRLYWVDAPESNSLRYGRPQCFGGKSKQMLEELIDGQKFNVYIKDTDKYGRSLVSFLEGGIEEKLLLSGAASIYHGVRKSAPTSFLYNELHARENMLGMWSCEEFKRKKKGK